MNCLDAVDSGENGDGEIALRIAANAPGHSDDAAFRVHAKPAALERRLELLLSPAGVHDCRVVGRIVICLPCIWRKPSMTGGALRPRQPGRAKPLLLVRRVREQFPI